jgi:hypothetical protein
VQRRDFIKSTVAVAMAAELGLGKAEAKVPAHDWDRYDFGSGPTVADRLNQGPFPQYPPDAVIPTDEVVMTTTSTDAAVPNYGKGLITYITADSGTDEIKADNIPKRLRIWSSSRWASNSTFVRPGGKCSPALAASNFPTI